MCLCVFYFLAVVATFTGAKASTILLERMSFTFQDKRYVEAFSGTKFINRTHKAVVGNLTIFVPLSQEETYVTFGAFKFARNKYIPTVLKMKENLYQALTNFDYFGVQEVKTKYITPVPQWPIKVNVTYHLREYVLNQSLVPPLLPAGNYKTVFEFFLNEKQKMATFSGFYKVLEALT